jgi:hypothetical protein
MNKCPPCTGDCIQGRACPAEDQSESAFGELWHWYIAVVIGVIGAASFLIGVFK